MDKIELRTIRPSTPDKAIDVHSLFTHYYGSCLSKDMCECLNAPMQDNIWHCNIKPCDVKPHCIVTVGDLLDVNSEFYTGRQLKDKYHTNYSLVLLMLYQNDGRLWLRNYKMQSSTSAIMINYLRYFFTTYIFSCPANLLAVV